MRCIQQLKERIMYIRRAIKTCAFILGLVLLLALSSRILMPKDNTEEAGMEEVYANGILGEKEDSIDVLIVGDSYSYTFPIPPEIWRDCGYTTYTCGTNDQSLDYTMVMLRRAFRRQHPRLVILEASPIYRDMSRFERLLAVLETHFPVFRYHDRWKGLGRDDFLRSPDHAHTLTKDYKGYRYYNKIVPAPHPDAEYMVQTDEVKKIPRPCLRNIKKIRKFCDSHGARLVLMSAPNALYWDYSCHNGIEALATELGCDYTDMNLLNDRIGIDWSHDTCDGGDHLNHAGAVKATRFLKEYLTSLGILEDHRGDPAYSEWDRCLKKYERQVAREEI